MSNKNNKHQDKPPKDDDLLKSVVPPTRSKKEQKDKEGKHDLDISGFSSSTDISSSLSSLALGSGSSSIQASAHGPKQSKLDEGVRNFDARYKELVDNSTVSDDYKSKISSVVAVLTDEEKTSVYPTLTLKTLQGLVDVNVEGKFEGFHAWKKRSGTQSDRTPSSSGSSGSTSSSTGDDSGRVSKETKSPKGDKKVMKKTPKERIAMASKSISEKSSGHDFMGLARERALKQREAVANLQKEDHERKEALRAAVRKPKKDQKGKAKDKGPIKPLIKKEGDEEEKDADNEDEEESDDHNLSSTA